MNKIAYFDLDSGISGDMLLGALLDLGGSEKTLNNVIDALGLDDVGVVIEKKEGPPEGVDVNIKFEDQPHRSLSDILDMIDNSSLESEVKKISMDVFKKLGKAEAEIHDMEKDEIEFHEVGMVDSLIDIVGSVALFKELGFEKAYASTIHFGKGTVDSAHGKLKVPVPATTKLLKDWTVNFSDKEGELVTPTGAALLRTLCTQKDTPDMKLEKIGVGYGDRKMEEPNALQVFSAEMTNVCEAMYEIQFYIDDMNPEIFSYSLEKIREESVEVYHKNAFGKKARNGWEVTVLCGKDKLEEIKELIFEETSTLGLRVQKKKRIVAERELKKVDTKWGEIKVKTSGVRIAPEYEDCKKIAEKNEIPLQKVYHEAIKEYKDSID